MRPSSAINLVQQEIALELKFTLVHAEVRKVSRLKSLKAESSTVYSNHPEILTLP